MRPASWEPRAGSPPPFCEYASGSGGRERVRPSDHSVRRALVRTDRGAPRTPGAREALAKIAKGSVALAASAAGSDLLFGLRWNVRPVRDRSRLGRDLRLGFVLRRSADGSNELGEDLCVMLLVGAPHRRQASSSTSSAFIPSMISASTYRARSMGSTGLFSSKTLDSTGSPHLSRGSPAVPSTQSRKSARVSGANVMTSRLQRTRAIRFCSTPCAVVFSVFHRGSRASMQAAEDGRTPSARRAGSSARRCPTWRTGRRRGP